MLNITTYQYCTLCRRIVHQERPCWKQRTRTHDVWCIDILRSTPHNLQYTPRDHSLIGVFRETDPPLDLMAYIDGTLRNWRNDVLALCEFVSCTRENRSSRLCNLIRGPLLGFYARFEHISVRTVYVDGHVLPLARARGSFIE